MWFGYAILAGSFYTVQGLLARLSLKSGRDAWVFSFYFSLIGALVSLPFMLSNMIVPKDISTWGLMLGVGGLIMLTNWLTFRATNFIEASISGAISKFRLV